MMQKETKTFFQMVQGYQNFRIFCMPVIDQRHQLSDYQGFDQLKIVHTNILQCGQCKQSKVNIDRHSQPEMPYVFDFKMLFNF